MSTPADPTNKPQHVRYPTFARGKVIAGGQEVDCDMLNVSLGGAKLRLAKPVEADADIRVQIDEVGEFTGRVVWRNGENVGVKFHHELRDIDRILETVSIEGANYNERRHAPRTSVLWSGKLHSAGQMVNCTVLNISARGAQIRCETLYDFGLNVILYIDGLGELAATVVWQNGATVGIAFQNDPRHIARVLGGALPILRQQDA